MKTIIILTTLSIISGITIISFHSLMLNAALTIEKRPIVRRF